MLSQEEVKQLRVSMRTLRSNSERLSTIFSGSGASLRTVELLRLLRRDLEIVEALMERLVK